MMRGPSFTLYITFDQSEITRSKKQTHARVGNTVMADAAIFLFRIATSAGETSWVSELSSPGHVVRQIVFNALKAEGVTGSPGCEDISLRMNSII